MILWLILASQAFAAGGGHGAAHGDTHIPWQNIGVQAFNFFLLFGLLTFLLRKTVKKTFADRASSYRDMVERAERAKRDAENAHAQIQERLLALERSATQGLDQARKEADSMRLRMITEAQDLGAKLKIEAERTASAELEKAKATLRAELLNKAIEASEKNLKSGLGSSDQKKLQDEFVDKIQAVKQ